MAKPKRYTEEQIIGVLKEIEAGASIASVSRLHGVNVQTLYRWQATSWTGQIWGGMLRPICR